MKICVYCSSSAKLSQVYLDATAEIAERLVDAGCEILYGGGALGLMGKLADVVLDKGGVITGVMPLFMREVEWQHPGVERYIFTRDMRERKAKLLEDTDAALALPGGTGTLDELFEAITLKRLGQYAKPIVILNVNGFYDPLREMLEKCIDENFMSRRNLDCWTFVEKPSDALPAIARAAEWDENAIHFAVNK